MINPLTNQSYSNSILCNLSKNAGKLLYSKFLWLFLSILLPISVLNAQQLPFAHLSIADGLEDTVIFSIEQDSYGFLWIATRTGINRFNGQRFWTYGKKDGLPHNLARNLMNSSQGVLWVASEFGVAWFDGEKFHAIEHWPENTSARALSEAADGSIWVATYGAGLIHITADDKPHIIEEINYKKGLPNDRVRSILIDRNGNIWAGFSNGIVRISKGTIKTIKWHSKATEVRTIFQHSDGSIWVGTRHGIARFNGQAFEALSLGNNIGKQTINTIIQDKENNIWLGSRDFGVYKFDANMHVSHLDMHDGLPDNSVNSIYQDNEGNLWFGTYGGGIARLSTSKVLNWKAQTNLSNPNIYSIAGDDKGCIWFGSNGNGVSSLCNNKISHFSREDGLPHNKVLSTLIDNDGTPWFGTLQGLSHYVDGKFINYGEADGLRGSIIYHIIQTTDNSIWIGTNNGLHRFDGNHFTYYNTSHGLPNNRINRVLESRNGGLWIASANGLTRYFEGKFTNYSTTEGLPANFINDFYEDELGGLWIATNSGLSYFFANQFKNWTTDDGLPHNNTTVILPGNKDEIWVGTSRGVAIFDGKNFTVITSREGLVFDLVNRGAGYKDTNGDLWFGTGEGISRFSADFKPGSSSPPPVHLLTVSNNQNQLNIGSHPTIQQQGSSLNFKYSAISFQRSPDVNFRYRLAKNANTAWRETRLRELQINSLADGDYTFEVTARVGTGQWNPQSATFQFTVTPPFWRTLWFMSAVFAAILGAFFYRNYRSRLHALQLENTVSERTKQLKELNKGLEWLANHDNLTRLANRNYIHEQLQQLEKENNQGQLGILILDLDFFKNINDQYGHMSGDTVLKAFAEMLQKIFRKDQIAARWGGEEFLIICPNIDGDILIKIARETLLECRKLNIVVAPEQTVKLNCSIGFALTPLHQKTTKTMPWEKTIQLADIALYNAKHNGRNRAIGYLWNTALPEQWTYKKVITELDLAIQQEILKKVILEN
jgi:diguanylate cyclase (GGDEF)-like protein